METKISCVVQENRPEYSVFWLSALSDTTFYRDAKKVRYLQQGGAFNPKLNILGNPYNFALNTKAAEYVFRHQDRLGKFTLIPTDTAKKLEWTAQGLAKFSPATAVRSLAFHGLYDPWELISLESVFCGAGGDGNSPKTGTEFITSPTTSRAEAAWITKKSLGGWAS